jgi:Phage integrase family
VQLSITGKGGKVRQVLLPEIVSCSLLSLRGYAGANDPVFVSRKGGRLAERTVNDMVKRAAKAAGINEDVSPHWLRHAHGSHAIERGASLPEVQATLGHGNIATTSGYLHARPDRSSHDESLSLHLNANSNQLAADAYAIRLLAGTRGRRVKPTLLPCADQQFGTQLEGRRRSCRRAASASDVRSYQTAQ